jgi:hypothetical protein
MQRPLRVSSVEQSGRTTHAAFARFFAAIIGYLSGDSHRRNSGCCARAVSTKHHVPRAGRCRDESETHSSRAPPREQGPG